MWAAVFWVLFFKTGEGVALVQSCLCLYFLFRNLASVVWYHAFGILCSLEEVKVSRWGLTRLCALLRGQGIVIYFLILGEFCLKLIGDVDGLETDCVLLGGDIHWQMSWTTCTVRLLACYKHTLMCWVWTFSHWRISYSLDWFHWLSGFWKKCWSLAGSTWPCLYNPRILVNRSGLVGSFPFRWRHSFMCNHHLYT